MKKNYPKGRYFTLYNMLPDKLNSILDYGSNEGYFAETIRKLYDKKISVFAAEIDEQYIAVGKNKYPNIRFLRITPGRRLPIKQKVDTIILSDVIEHIPKNTEKKLIKELYSYINKKGILVLSTPNKDPIGYSFVVDPANFFIHPLVTLVKKMKIPSTKKDEKYLWHNNNESWHRHYSIEEIREICRPYFEIKNFKRRGSILTAIAYFSIIIVDMPLAYIDNNKFIHTIREIWKFIPQRIMNFDLRYISLGRFSYHITVELQAR